MPEQPKKKKEKSSPVSQATCATAEGNCGRQTGEDQPAQWHPAADESGGEESVRGEEVRQLERRPVMDGLWGCQARFERLRAILNAKVAETNG